MRTLPSSKCRQRASVSNKRLTSASITALQRPITTQLTTLFTTILIDRYQYLKILNTNRYWRISSVYKEWNSTTDDSSIWTVYSFTHTSGCFGKSGSGSAAVNDNQKLYTQRSQCHALLTSDSSDTTSCNKRLFHSTWVSDWWPPLLWCCLDDSKDIQPAKTSHQQPTKFVALDCIPSVLLVQLPGMTWRLICTTWTYL